MTCNRFFILALTLAALVLFAWMYSGRAFAQECRLPHAREQFRGYAVTVTDGDTFRMRTNWCPSLRVRLADFSAPERYQPGGPEATAALRQIVQGHRLRCIATRGRHGSYSSHGRSIAICRTGRATLGDQLRATGIVEGGN
jgi:endonuclease YncB( thermonuclease family)